jgi:8-oxo-dGTP pyrophosphatase MutT (NUDIX family)
MRTVIDQSAGGVIYRVDHGRVDVCLIATAGGKRWQLPKGGIDPGETPEQAAVREVREETGLKGTLLEKIAAIDFWFLEGSPAVRHHKFVTFFLVRYDSGDTTDHDDEVDDARWFELKLAISQATFANERQILRSAQARIADLEQQAPGAEPEE